MSAASLAFRIVYKSIYYLLYLVLLAFLIVTPADLIRRASQAVPRQSWNIIVIILCYVVTVVVVAFAYSVRLYLNRSVIASIPKTWIPIEKEDVPREVRQVIVQGLSKSAAIFHAARPRIETTIPQEPSDQASRDTRRQAAAENAQSAEVVGGAEVGVSPPQVRPVWGEIEHPGWAPPTSTDLPNLQYASVISELPDLIEAKALTLDHSQRELLAETGVLDPAIADLLQRHESMTLREYLGCLTELAVLPPTVLTNDFITSYEHARYSGRPLTNCQFRHLMHLFAELLRIMQPFDSADLMTDDDASENDNDEDSVRQRSRGDGFLFDDALSDSDIDNDAPRGTNPSTSGGSRHQSNTPSIASSSEFSRRPETVALFSSAKYKTTPKTTRTRHMTGLLPSRTTSTNVWAV